MRQWRFVSPDDGYGWRRRLPTAGGFLAQRHVLSARGSLTRFVRSLSRDFSVRVLCHAPGRPERDGAPLLGIAAGAHGWVREVMLMDGDAPLVFAHTLVARTGLDAWPWLRGLGTRPLGEVLFAHPRVVRLPLRYRRLDARHPLYHAARRASGTDAPTLWARRSLFWLDGGWLLVTEVFLPSLWSRLADRPSIPC